MPEVETPSAIYLAGRREWNERYGSYISRAKHWRWMACGLLFTTAISTASAVWLAAQSRVVPYVVTVDHLGDALAVRRLEAAPPIDAARIKSQLARWIVDTRSVWTDMNAELNISTQAYDWTDKASDAWQQLDAWFQSTKPNVRAEKETVGVAIESVGQIGADTWSVDWSEEHRAKDGSAPVTSYWRATLRVKVDPPIDEATILANPSGLYVTWFKITPRVR